MHDQTRDRISSPLIGLVAWLGLLAPMQSAKADDGQAKSGEGHPSESERNLEKRHAKLSIPPSDPLDLTPDFGVRPKRSLRAEWTVSSFDIDRGHFIGATGFGLSGSFWMPQRPAGMRIFETGAKIFIGDIGDERHGVLHGQFSYQPRFNIPIPMPFIELYAGPRGSFIISHMRDRNTPGYSASVGQTAGVSIAGGLIDAEVTASALFPINDEFRAFGEAHGDKWKPRFDVTLATDICFFGGGTMCRYPAPQAVQVNLTELLNGSLATYAKGHRGDAVRARQELCDAARRAVSIVSSTEAPSDDETGTEQFFCRMEASMANSSASRELLHAHYVHRQLEVCYSQFVVDARAAKHDGKSLRRAEQYLPDPPELRRALACEQGADAYTFDALQMERACAACPAACRPTPADFDPQCPATPSRAH